MNTPTLERLHLKASVPTEAARYENPDELMLVYLGLLEWTRGLKTVILAIQKVKDSLPNVSLTAIGFGRDEETFRRAVTQLGLTRHVHFPGWVDYEEAIAHIAACDIGLVSHHATDSWNTTILSKLFDYMAMGKPASH